MLVSKLVCHYGNTYMRSVRKHYTKAKFVVVIILGHELWNFKISPLCLWHVDQNETLSRTLTKPTLNE